MCAFSHRPDCVQRYRRVREQQLPTQLFRWWLWTPLTKDLTRFKRVFDNVQRLVKQLVQPLAVRLEQLPR